MSQGIFQLSNDGPYRTVSGVEIPADIYKRTDYTDTRFMRYFVDWGVLDKDWEAVSRIVGELLEKIQRASMVSVESARAQVGEPIDPNDDRDGYLRDSWGYHSTLSGERLVETIRNEFAGILVKIATLSENPEIAQKYAGLSRFRDNAPRSMRHLPSPQFNEEKTDELFEGVNFLTPESQTLLEILEVSGEIIVAVQQALRGFAQIAWIRAKLSRPSTLADLSDPPAFISSEKTRGGIKPSVMYSTLHPYDYIRMVKGQLSSLLNCVAFAVYKEREGAKAA